MQLRAVLATLVFLYGCVAGIIEQRRPGVIAHRGVVRDAPENTLPALQRAIDLGCALAEIDLRYTADGEVILIHDATLERTTTGAGEVARMSLSQIRELDAGARYGERYAGTKVPTLKEAIELARGKIQLYLDLKEYDPKPVGRVVQEMEAQSSVFFRPYTFWALREIVSTDPRFRVLVDLGDWVQAPGLMEMLKREFPTAAFSTDLKNWTPRMVERARRLSIQTFVNVLGPEDTIDNLKRALDMGFDYIQTDQAEQLLQLIRTHRGEREPRP